MLEGVWNINKHRADATRVYHTSQVDAEVVSGPPEWPKTSGEPFGESLFFGPKTEILKIFGISLGRHTGPLRADGVAVRRLRARHRPVRCGIRPCGIRAMFIYVPNTFQHTQEASATARERGGSAQAAPEGVSQNMS